MENGSDEFSRLQALGFGLWAFGKARFDGGVTDNIRMSRFMCCFFPALLFA